MRIHHLNCGTDCPVGGALFDGYSGGALGRLVCHCLLIETDAHGLVLVDTGYGLRDVAHPHGAPPRITRQWRAMLNIQLREQECAVRQIAALGLDPADVRHIVLTHLDFDHAGGLEDFPNATVHVLEREYRDATGPARGVVHHARYRPPQLAGVDRWRLYPASMGEGWFGFDAVRGLEGLPPEILLVPLPGHSWGHAGVAIRRGGEREWLLHAGDAYFYRGEMRSARRRCTPGLAAYQRLMEVDRTRRMTNQARLRRLSVERRGDVQFLCAHDPEEFDRAVLGRAM